MSKQSTGMSFFGEIENKIQSMLSPGSKLATVGTSILQHAREISIDRISPDPEQPRKDFSETKLIELAESVKQSGVIQPIHVAYIEADGNFQIVAGERRYRASLIAGLKTMPCLIVSLDDSNHRTYQLVENIQRVDLSPIEKARAMLKLKDTMGESTPWKEVDKVIGISERRRQQFMALLNLPPHMQAHIVSGDRSDLRDLSEKHARALLVLKELPDEQEKMFQEMLTDAKLSGDRALTKARSIKKRDSVPFTAKFKYRDKDDLIQQLQDRLKELKSLDF